MRDPNRIDTVLASLKAYWEANPDMRLGQIVTNVSLATRNNFDAFYMEDDTFVAGLDRLTRKEIEDGNSNS